MNGTTPQSSPRRAGFTILELAVVMSLILILTSIVAPTFRISTDRRVENVAHMMVAHLEVARTKALGSRVDVVIQFLESQGQYVAFADHDGNDVISGTADEIAAFPEFGLRELEEDQQVVFGRGSASALPGDGSSAAITFASDRFRMDHQGLPEPWGTVGFIYLRHRTDADAVSAVAVNSSGSFKAWRWSAEEGEWK